MNKAVGSLFLMIIALATLAPCCLFDNCNEEVVITKNGQKKRDLSDACSRCFSCSTCSGYTFAAETISVPAAPVSALLHIESNPDYSLVTFPTLPWQPPRSAA